MTDGVHVSKKSIVSSYSYGNVSQNIPHSGQETILTVQAIDTKRAVSLGEKATQLPHYHMPGSLKGTPLK